MNAEHQQAEVLMNSGESNSSRILSQDIDDTDKCSSTCPQEDFGTSEEQGGIDSDQIKNAGYVADLSNEEKTVVDVVVSSEETEPVMTLLPPPPAWFQFDDDAAMHASSKQTQLSCAGDKLNSHQTSQSVSDAITHIDSSSSQLERHSTSVDAKTMDHLESSEELSEESNAILQIHLPLLPEYDSNESQLFDTPVSFAYTPCDQCIPEESDAISTQSAIDTIISQTLQFSSQTVSKTIPILLHECSSSAIQKALHKLRLEYARFGPKKYLRASDLGSVGGYFRPSVIGANELQLETSVALGKGKDNHFDWMWIDGREVRFTNLPWVERQLVHEWRTYEWTANDGLNGSDCIEGNFCLESSDDHVEIKNNHRDWSNSEENVNNSMKKGQNEDIDEGLSSCDEADEFDQTDFKEYERARTLAPRPLPRPEWEHALSCYSCQRAFGPALHRHHCRRCGHSYCNTHSNYFHQLPHLGYDRDVHERVCRSCKIVLDSRDLEERVAVSRPVFHVYFHLHTFVLNVNILKYLWSSVETGALS